MSTSAQTPSEPSQPGNVPRWIFPASPENSRGHSRVCAFCGEEAPPDSAFCPNDGRALSAALMPEANNSVTVVFTDIEDSVQLTERLGDEVWADLVDDHNDIVRASIARFAGFEVKATGDGFLIVFADPIRALESAAAIQQQVMARASQRPNWPVRVAIGIHRGEVLFRPGGDILGRTVNMAQRIMEKSAGGEIWLSEAVQTKAAEAFRPAEWRDHGWRRLRGVPDRQHLYELLWWANETGAEAGDIATAIGSPWDGTGPDDRAD